MINRFDTSIDKGYISNRIELPFAELQGIAATQQKNYDDTINETYKLQDMMNLVPVINDPNLGLSNVQAKKDLDNKYSQRISEVADKIVKGNDLMSAQRDLNRLKREYVNDPNRIELENSYKNYVTYKDDITKKAGKYDTLLDDYRGQQLYGDTGLKPFRYAGMEDKLDIEKRFAETMDKIKEDTKEWDVESLGQDGIKIGSKGRAAGITEDKVLGLAKTKVVGVLTQTPEGQQFIKKFQRLNPNATQEDILNAGVNLLFSSGAQQIFSDKLSGNSVDVTSMWGALRKESQDKEAQMASTTPETLNLIDNGEMSKIMPSELSKFYSGNNIDLTNSTDPGTKEAGDRIANNGGWLNLDIMKDTTGSIKKKSIEYVNELYENASKILGTSKNQVAQIYKSKGNDGYNWLKNTVETYYNNLSLQKNTVATLQGAEQQTATNFFLGNKISDKDKIDDAVGSNVRASELTDLNGNIITKKDGINSNNFNVSSIGFTKPGQVVLSDNTGTQLYMNTNYETFKNITKPVVDIVSGSDSFKKSFKLTEEQKRNLGSKSPIESKLNIEGNILNKTTYDKKQFNIGNTVYNIDSYLIRENGSMPVEYHYVVETDPFTGERKESTLTENQLKIKFSNAIINSPEFRGINKQKENKVSFDNEE